MARLGVGLDVVHKLLDHAKDGDLGVGGKSALLTDDVKVHSDSGLLLKVPGVPPQGREEPQVI